MQGPSRWTGKRRRKAKPPLGRETSSRTVGARRVGAVGLAAELEGLERDRQLEPLALAVGEREAREIDDRRRRLAIERTSAGSGLTMAASRRGYEMGQFDWKPDEYLERIRAEVPRYDELQEQASRRSRSRPSGCSSWGWARGRRPGG